MTVLALKSTLLPMRLPLILPSFPFSRALMAFRGRPDFCMALGCRCMGAGEQRCTRRC